MLHRTTDPGGSTPTRKEVYGMRAILWALIAVAMSPVGGEVALANGSAAARGSAVVLGGTTSNGWPVVAELSRDGRFIKRVLGGIYADCSEGGGWAFPSEWRDLRVSRTGAFKASYDDTDVDEGVEVTYFETLAGKLNRARTKLTATWRASTTFTYPDGTANVCDSGPLRVTLR
jgi:hypothetical protein